MKPRSVYDKKERVVQPQAVIERTESLIKGTLLSLTDVEITLNGQLNTNLPNERHHIQVWERWDCVPAAIGAEN